MCPHTTTKNWTNDASIKQEYAANLGDKRRTRRAMALGLALSRIAGLSLPKLLTDEADLEAAYRFIRNDSCDCRELLAAHQRQTIERSLVHDEVVVAHDTTTLSYPQYWADKQRSNMAGLTSRTQGFFVHASFAIGGDERALPLGLVEARPFVHRSDIEEDEESLDFWDEEGGLFDNEKQRWFSNVAYADDLYAAKGIKPVHVMDREADSFGFLSWLVSNDMRFVTRGNTPRGAKVSGKLKEFGQVVAQLGERFDLRNGKSKKTNPPRKARTARLNVRAGKLMLNGAKSASSASYSPGGFEAQPEQLELHLVEVTEPNPPADEQGVRWLLLTTEPIDTAEQVLQIVEWYRRRWLIEEYFKALKSGCRIQERQMESASNMLRILALLVPAAWRLLLLRAIATDMPKAHWSCVLTRLEFTLLTKRLPKARLREDATVEQVLRAVAKLGGHLPRNGRPGWQSLHAGWRRLSDLAIGARIMGAEDAINP